MTIQQQAVENLGYRQQPAPREWRFIDSTGHEITVLPNGSPFGVIVMCGFVNVILMAGESLAWQERGPATLKGATNTPIAIQIADEYNRLKGEQQ